MGLIPAHAGSTQSSSQRQHPPPAHPRSRGEHVAGKFEVVSAWGSSPLTRGALKPLRPTNHLQRLIPAHAGSTNGFFVMTDAEAAHPRSRGEHVEGRERYNVSGGSSPLTRGAREHTLNNGLHSGLIPAHAGSTRPLTLRSGGTRAHPRSRGEHRA